MIALGLIIVFSFSSLLCMVALVAVAYRAQLRYVIGKANENAGLWAESEAKLYDAVTGLARAEQEAMDNGKRADGLSRIAREALRLAHAKQFPGNITPTFRDVAQGSDWSDITPTPLADIQRARDLITPLASDFKARDCQWEGFHDDPNCPLTIRDEWPDVIDSGENS